MNCLQGIISMCSVGNNILEFYRGRTNYSNSLRNLERDFNLLKDRAVDLERDIRERREVTVWFQEVNEVEREYRAFENEEQRKGFLQKMFSTGDEATRLNARIRDLYDWSRRLGELAVGDDDNTRVLPRPTSGLEGEAFQDNFERIWNLLENDQVSSIGVHGMGGVGKSTLVDNIHNHLLERNTCVFLVVVSSQRCSIKMLQDKIAQKLGLDHSEEEDEGARAGRLNRALSQRENFILILDDVWECFDLVKVGIPLSMKGCKWMMTSRSLKVCREMNCQEKIVVEPLHEDEGWKLFLEKLGKDATLALGDPKVEEIAKCMVKICDGLPLGIIALAGAVSGLSEIQEWRHELGVLKEPGMGHEWMEEKVFRVLKYSFDRLNLNDQRCFLYCSLYPEDYKIYIESLVKNLISEKLVDEKKSRGAQRDEAYSIVSRLVKVSLLESDSYINQCEYVKMHDLVRGMAHKITKGKTMVVVGERSRKEIPAEEEWTEDLDKVSLMLNGIKEIPLGTSPNCPRLTTLILAVNPLKRIATTFFLQMCSLRTLNLSHTQIEALPDSVSDLVNLMSLLLEECWELQHVPCVRKLKELRELDLSGTAIEEIPQGMEALLNVRFLSMREANGLSRTSLKLKLPRVQVLRLPRYVEAELVEGGGEFLEGFEGRLKHVSHFNTLFASKKDDGVWYSIMLGDYDLEYEEAHFEPKDDARRSLCACGYNFNGRPVLAADYIQCLEFWHCKCMRKCLLDNLTNPASLKKLTISNSTGIECLLTTQPQFKSRFQALEELVLRNLEELMGVIHKLKIEAPPPPSVFSSLRKLDISGCHKMKNLGLPLSVIEIIEYISIYDCEEIENIIQVAAGDDALLISLPRLRSLHLVGLPTLESFCDASVICNSLEFFTFEDCPRLEVPFLKWGTPDSYKPLFPGFGVQQVRSHSL